MKSDVVVGLTLLRDAYKNQLEELDLCNSKYRKLRKEIMEIDYLIQRQEEIQTRRQREYEKRLRAIKRKHHREIRRRVYLGLRMDPVGSGDNHGMVHLRSNPLRRCTWQGGRWTQQAQR